MGKHTPGPWRVAANETDSYRCRSGRVEDARFLIRDEDDYAIAMVITDIEELTGTANARLIAAAPELLEACRKLANEAAGFLGLSDIKRHGMTNSRILRQRIEEARDAIAKVESQE